MYIDHYGITDIGKRQKVNEDQFIIADLNREVIVQQTSVTKKEYNKEYAKLFIVADGIGGHLGGQAASAIAVETVVRYAANTIPWFPAQEEYKEEIGKSLKKVLALCKRNVEAVGETSQMNNMGTTLTVGYVLWPHLYIAHIGDSRCYLLRYSEISQMTEDDTIGAVIAKARGLDPSEAKPSDWDNILSNAIGGSKKDASFEPELGYTKLWHNDCLLLCTDGLSNQVSKEKIFHTVKFNPSSQTICEKLVGMANEAGGNDNVTVVVAQFKEDPSSST